MQDNKNNEHEKLKHNASHWDVISPILFVAVIFVLMFVFSRFLA